MGQRSSTETLAAVFTAFMAQKTWAQAELAREVDVNVRALRRILDELTMHWPLEREEDPPHVYWSLPKDFFPGGLVFKDEELGPLLRVIACSPLRKERSDVLAAVIARFPKSGFELLDRVTPGRLTPEEAGVLSILEDALEDSSALLVSHFSSSRGRLVERTISVQRVALGPPARCIAHCHLANELRWFRVDAILSAKTSDEPFRAATKSELDALEASSVNGFAHGKPLSIAFSVKDPEARWVKGNLPVGLRASPTAEGIRVETTTAGLVPVARFVAGLGEAVTIESNELRDAVRTLAEGALRATSKTE